MKRGERSVARQKGLTLRMFSEADLDDIHLGTLDVLERAGVFVQSDEACDIFSDGGCTVDREAHRVRIPAHVVTDALQSARSAFRLGARDPDRDVLIEKGRVTHAPFAEGVMANDLEDGSHRESRLQDVADVCKAADALDQIDINGVAVTPRDVPEEDAAILSLRAAYANTTKPVGISMISRRDCEAAIAMATVLAGDVEKLAARPMVTFGGCPVAPLGLVDTWTEVVITGARAGVPLICISMGMAGGSTPITLSGTLLVQNAEQLASLVLAQLVNRGNPFWYGSSTCTIDMRYGTAAVGTPETALYQAGTVAMADYYSMPSWTAGY